MTTVFSLEEMQRTLERTPAMLRLLLEGAPEALLTGTEGPETWSPINVVGHLIDGDRYDWMPRLRVILGRRESRRFEPFDRFHHLTAYRDVPIAALLDTFERERVQNLAELRAVELGDEALRRTGEHPELGEVTLAQLLATWVAHDLTHLAQVTRVLAKQYVDDVGPWAAYLGPCRDEAERRAGTRASAPAPA